MANRVLIRIYISLLYAASPEIKALYIRNEQDTIQLLYIYHKVIPTFSQ